ncbi:MAG: S8 family serine peptidase [Chitinophagales bacterium]|nr:S8 family serine peptidase [Chitinophagales bacterium]
MRNSYFLFYALLSYLVITISGCCPEGENFKFSCFCCVTEESCTITSSVSVECNNNGTPDDSGDDQYVISLSADINGDNSSTQYEVVVDDTTFGPFNYGTTATIILEADGSSPTLLFRNIGSVECSTEEVVGPLIPCSACRIIPDISYECIDPDLCSSGDEYYLVKMEVSNANNESTGYEVLLDDEVVDTFLYNGLDTISLPADGYIHQLLLRDLIDQSCDTLLETAPLVSCPEDCPAGTIEVIEDEFILVVNDSCFNNGKCSGILNNYIDGMIAGFSLLDSCSVIPKMYLFRVEAMNGLTPVERVAHAEGEMDQEEHFVTAYRNASFNLNTIELDQNLVFHDMELSSPSQPTSISEDNMVIAVIDGGIALDEDYFGNYKWTNQDEAYSPSMLPYGIDHIDNDNNGFVDDFYGYDFILNLPLGSGALEHGSKVASVIINAYKEYESILEKQLQLMDCKIFDKEGQSNTFTAACAMHYAMQEGADVLNLSWGFYAEPDDTSYLLIEAAIDSAIVRGIPVITAAGNDTINIDNCNFYPAYFAVKYPNVLSVGALANDGSLADFSNYGCQGVSVAALGKEVEVLGSDGGNSQSQPRDGTSYSAPFVSLLVGYLKAAKPSKSVESIIDFIKELAGMQLPNINGIRYGGLLNDSSTFYELESFASP